MSTRTYAIGDIHGHRDKLAAAHDLVAQDRARTGDDEAPVVHLGDLVDRGPDSAGVIDDLIAGIEAGERWIALLGNHDRMLREFLKDETWQDPGLRPDLHWLNPRLGGDATLRSYGVEDVSQHDLAEIRAQALGLVPAAHRDFLDTLPLTYERAGALYVHAGIRPGRSLVEQTETDLVWIRHGFLEDRRDHGWLVVHGHTALERPRHFGNRVDLDSGAGHGGPLTAAVIEDGEVWVLTRSGRSPLRAEI